MVFLFRLGRQLRKGASQHGLLEGHDVLSKTNSSARKAAEGLGRARSSTLRLSPVFRFRRRRCLPLHVVRNVNSTALQRLYVVDDVAWTSPRSLARRRTWMLLLETASCSPRTLDVPVLVPHARCAAVGGMHGAVPLWHQGQAPEHPEEQERDLPHRQSQYPVTRGDAQCFGYARWYLRNTNTEVVITRNGAAEAV